MSLLKTNEIQNYNGSSLTLTASTVSTSAQLNTGGNISVTGSLNVSDDSTTRSNLGLGSSDTASFQSLTINGVTNQGFPSGTKMLFQQTAAPTGWTKDTSHDNKALRVVSGTAGSGGSVAFTTAFASGLSAGNTTLTVAQMPSHNHTTAIVAKAFDSAYDGLQGGTASNNTQYYTSDSKGSSNAHNHTLPSFDVYYVDLIIATKD